MAQVIQTNDLSILAAKSAGGKVATKAGAYGGSEVGSIIGELLYIKSSNSEKASIENSFSRRQNIFLRLVIYE